MKRAVDLTTSQKSRDYISGQPPVRPIANREKVSIGKDLKNPPPPEPPITIFDQRWAAVFFDEAHELRTEGPALQGAICLSNMTPALLLATATPVYTSERVRCYQK